MKEEKRPRAGKGSVWYSQLWFQVTPSKFCELTLSFIFGIKMLKTPHLYQLTQKGAQCLLRDKGSTVELRGKGSAVEFLR